jgi:hypothetical protein
LYRHAGIIAWLKKSFEKKIKIKMLLTIFERMTSKEELDKLSIHQAALLQMFNITHWRRLMSVQMPREIMVAKRRENLMIL